MRAYANAARLKAASAPMGRRGRPRASSLAAPTSPYRATGSMSSQYNARPCAAEVLVEEGAFRVVRERETFEDLMRGESV
jgi:hypothetical protein